MRVAVRSCELNLCRYVLRMPVPVAVCQAERNVDEERSGARGGGTERGREWGREKSGAQVLRTRVPLGYKRSFSIAETCNDVKLI